MSKRQYKKFKAMDTTDSTGAMFSWEGAEPGLFGQAADRLQNSNTAKRLLAKSRGEVQPLWHETFAGLIQPGAIEALVHRGMDPDAYLAILVQVFGCKGCFENALARIIAGLRFAQAHATEIQDADLIEVIDDAAYLTAGFWEWMADADCKYGGKPSLDEFDGHVFALRAEAANDEDAEDFDPLSAGGEDLSPEEFLSGNLDPVDYDRRCRLLVTDALDPDSDFYKVDAEVEAGDLLQAMNCFCFALLASRGYHAGESGISHEEVSEKAARWFRSDDGLNEALIEIDIQLARKISKWVLPSAKELMSRVKTIHQRYSRGPASPRR